MIFTSNTNAQANSTNLCVYLGSILPKGALKERKKERKGKNLRKNQKSRNMQEKEVEGRGV